jgi:hypothetical protein
LVVQILITVLNKIFCGRGEETLKFYICAEHKTIYSGLNVNDALAVFFYVAFIGNLEYRAKGEAVAVWLQRKIAGINFEGKFFIWQQKKVVPSSDFKTYRYR